MAGGRKSGGRKKGKGLFVQQYGAKTSNRSDARNQDKRSRYLQKHASAFATPANCLVRHLLQRVSISTTCIYRIRYGTESFKSAMVWLSTATVRRPKTA